MILDWNRITHLFQIPLRWFREIDRRATIIGDGQYITIDRNNPNGTIVSLDPSALPSASVPDNVLTTDDIGSKVAAQNHSHSGYAAANHNHNGVYQPVGNYAAASHTHTASQVTDLGNAATKNVGTGSNNVAAGNHTHSDMVKTSDLRTALGTNGKVLTTNDVCAAGDIVPCNDDHATVPPNHRHYHTYIVNSVATTAVKVLGWVADSAANTAASLISVFSPDTSKTGVVFNTKGTISYKSIGTTSGTVAAGDHTHTASQVTDLGDAATKNVGTAAGTVAAGNHTHGYAVLSSSDSPAAPVLYTDSSGNANSSAIGIKTTAARADHVHRLPDGIMVLSYAQWITGNKRFRNGTVRICADNSGTQAEIFFRDGADNTTWGGLQANNSSSVKALQLYYKNSSSVNTVFSVYDDYVSISKGGQNGWTTIGRGFMRLNRSGDGAKIYFRYNNSSTDTSAISETASGVITITSANHARLSVAPIVNPTATGYNALQIATIGAIRDNFFVKDTSSTGVVRNAAGTISYINNTNASQTVDVITDVVWNGTKLQKKKKTLTYTYGVLTGVSAETTVDIDSAVTYNP